MTDRLQRSRSGTAGRQGMLLLVVLLMLSLFLGIGAILLTIAARARAAARASAAATTATSFGDALARDALDQALMAALRGAASGTDGAVTINGGPMMESLLADKHGIITASGTPWFTGTCILISATTSPLITLNLEGMSRTPSGAQLNGRILTLMPAPGNGDVSSYRIIGSSGGASPICYVAQMPGTGQAVLPSGTFNVLINGRDFAPMDLNSLSPEAFDAYDTASSGTNPFLAQPQITTGQFNGTYTRVSYGGAAGATVDNDNDGVNDGVWISGTTLPSPFISGTIIPSQPSPLGGTIRFDVSYLIVDLDGRLNLNTAGSGLTLTSGSYAGGPAYATNLAPGMGYGPADVNPAFVLPPTTASGSLPLALSTTSNILIVGGTPSTTLAAPTSAQVRLPPRIGRVDGRYGWTSGTSMPGLPGDDSDTSQRTSVAAYATTFAGNSHADIRSRAKVFMAAGTAPSPPILTFQLPTSLSGTDAATNATDDPYELRLDADGPRFGVPRRPAAPAGQIDDNVYTLAELERVLRPNDVDAPQLAPRLAAVLGDEAQRRRMQITTDSWDTVALTGSTAAQIESQLLSGTVTAATRLRALVYPWTPTNPASPDVAAGLRFNVNRPATTAAAQQNFCKGLYTLIAALRPAFDRQRAAQWAVNVLDFCDSDSRMTRFQYASDLTTGWPITTPPLDVWGVERPDLVIAQVSNNGAGTVTSAVLLNPYRALLGTGTTEIVDSSLWAAGLTNSVDFKKVVGTDSVWRLRVGASTLAGQSASTTPFAPHVPQTVPLSLAAGSATTLVLERLADPTLAFNATTNPYRTVDEKPITYPSTPQTWTHWPNRPLISHGELLLVPSGSTAFVTGAAVQSLAIDIPEILDATYVPTLFAGHAVTVSGAQVNTVGLNELPSNQLPKWREPGRINVNTIPAGDTHIWTALMAGSPPASNPFAGTPATSLGQLLNGPAPLTFTDDRKSNNFFARAHAIRLASAATVRSHVFAIWITVRITDTSSGAPSPVTKRLFAIVDRSIPVGFLPGFDLNVRDMIKIRTFID